MLHKPIYPGEIPAPSGMMREVIAVNVNPDIQFDEVCEDFSPFLLDTDSSSDFFGIGRGHSITLSHPQRRALTALQWRIEDLADLYADDTGTPDGFNSEVEPLISYADKVLSNEEAGLYTRKFSREYGTRVRKEATAIFRTEPDKVYDYNRTRKK